MDDTKRPSQQSQLDRFKEAARQLGCDEDEAAFDETLKGIARQRTEPERITDSAVIHEMTQRFEKTGNDASGWITDYRDPRSGATWQLTYPQGEMHGGGPPLLTRTS